MSESEIAAAEQQMQEAAKKVQRLKNDASREAAAKLFLDAALPRYEDVDTAAFHHMDCRSVTKWLGRNGNTPKESLKYFPLPKDHPNNRSYCPGCACESWADCLRKSGFTAH